MINLLSFLQKSSFTKNIIKSFVGQSSFVLFTMVFTLVCTRLYGVDVFGQYTFGFSIITILMILASSGLDNGLMYYMPKVSNKYVSFSFLMNFIFSMIIIIIVFFIVDKPIIHYMLPLVWLVSMENLFFGLYRATNNISKFFMMYGFLAFLIRIGLVVLFYYYFDGSVSFILISVYISFIISNIVYFIQNKKRFGKIYVDFTFLKYSFPLVLAGFTTILIYRVDVVMLGFMTNNASVGIYQITMQIANVVGFVILIFNTAFAPKISELFHENKKLELKNLYIKSTRILALVALIISVFLISGSELILLAFGEEVTQGQTTLILRVAAQFFTLAVGSVWFMLSMTGDSKSQMIINLFAAIINIALNFLLIPMYGIEGAAIASMISIILMSLIGYFLVRNKFQIKVFKFF
ncbi:polysaccharide biosynthesis C-terminal domain-containing protein [Halobacillus trueperi]|uniref:oligosaccharide flippase family protein n=1 Tax=Halobacillus trueperi TaxID=156205 RepID=UPI0037353629